MALGLALGCTSAAISASASDDTNAPPATNAPAAQPYGKKVNVGFFKRLNEAFMEQSATQCYTPPTPPAPGAPTPPPSRRIGDPPFDSPPYPDADWQLGGGPNVIGDPGALRDSPYPLMQTLYDGPHGKAWYDSRVQIYGWEDVGGNVSTSRNNSPSSPTGGLTPNFPEVYDERPDRVEQDQFVVYVERMADENQLDHIDWGFRYSFVYGLDYRFMSSRGFLDHQVLQDNQFQGIDMPMMYANLYLPHIAQGMNVILGRIISLPDIEQQLAPNNLMYSHSITYGFDNYTEWGLWTATKLNSQLVLQVGLSCGVDIAPWEKQDPGDQPTPSILLQWILPNGKDELYGGMNSFNNGNFGYNNLQEAMLCYSHKFNDRWWTTFENQYMYMKHTTTSPTTTESGTLLPAGGREPVPYQDGFFPVRPGFCAEGGILNYTCCRIAPNAFLTIRNEWYDDSSGARTGYASSYDENGIGITWWPNKLIVLRPEIRYEHSFAATSYNAYYDSSVMHGAYDSGTKHDQFTFACDLQFHF
jgi:hypothetical protein